MFVNTVHRRVYNGQYCNGHLVIWEGLLAGPNTLRSCGFEIKCEMNAENFAGRATGFSCDSLELLAPNHAHLLAPSGAAAFGRAGASGTSATFLSMRVCRRSAAGHARLLARSDRRCGQRPARPPAALSAVLPNPASLLHSLAGDDASAARYICPSTDAGFTNGPSKDPSDHLKYFQASGPQNQGQKGATGNW
jgi:hypothetical protein